MARSLFITFAALLTLSLAACAQDAASETIAADPAPSAAPEPSPSASSAAPSPATPPQPAFLAGALYAPLFERGRAWTLGVTAASGTYGANGDWDRTLRPRELETCRVEEVEIARWGARSTVKCSGRRGRFASPISGVWVATMEGLHLLPLGKVPAERDATLDARVLPRIPVASRTTKRDDPAFDWGTTTTVSQRGAAWCWSSDTIDPDHSWTSVCFEAGSGIVSGAAGFSNYLLDEITFEVLPPH